MIVMREKERGREIDGQKEKQRISTGRYLNFFMEN